MQRPCPREHEGAASRATPHACSNTQTLAFDRMCTFPTSRDSGTMQSSYAAAVSSDAPVFQNAYLRSAT